jgi:competence protein ComEA
MARKFFQFIRLFLRRSLGYSSTEARAFVVLNMLIIIVLALPWFVEKYYANHRWMSEDDLYKLDSLIIGMSSNQRHFQENDKPAVFVPSILNPNLTNRDSLLLSGLNRRATENLIKYREKGGRFRSINDLYKIYDMDSSWVAQHVDIFSFRDHVVHQKQIDHEAQIELNARKKINYDQININNTTKIDINLADTEAFKKLPGIGDILSERMVKYRNLVGGFVEMDQLAEVYGVDQETVSKILPLVYIENEFTPRKINLNTVPLYYMKRHPYIGEKMALQIDSLRKITKPLDSIQVVEIIITSESEKVLPYIGF